MDTWHKKRMLLGEAEEKWRGEAGGVPPAPSPRGADHQKCSCPDLHTSTLPPPRGSPLFSPWKPADSPAGKEAKAGLTVAGGRAGTAGRGGRILGLSFVICRSSRAGSRSGGGQRQHGRSIPGTAVRSPDPQGVVVFSQQRMKKPPPQTQSPRSHLPSLSGRASLGASVPKGAWEWPPGLWLSAAWPDGPWPWPARPGSRPGRCLPPPSTHPWPKCECWLPLPRGRARGRAQVLRTRPRTEQPATSLCLPLGYTPENIL